MIHDLYRRNLDLIFIGPRSDHCYSLSQQMLSNFSHLLHGCVEVLICICQRCQMYFSLSANYTKLKFNHDFEACASAFQLIWFWSLQELLVSAKALKHSMRLYDIFKIWTLRRRHRKQGRISNFKWLEAALNFVDIKNPFGSVQTNPQTDAWWVPLLILLKKCFSGTPYLTYSSCLIRLPILTICGTF